MLLRIDSIHLKEEEEDCHHHSFEEHDDLDSFVLR